LQALAGVRFTLEEEETLDITLATERLQRSFDKDRVTKKFYDRFQKEHAAFLKFIQGIQNETDQKWYASLMLNRLMFVYFIQKKGFLDGDLDYLKHRLERLRRQHGDGQFHTFYRHFLRRLFHEGLGQPETQRTPDLDDLLGVVPYLNGGLFDVHELEHEYTGVDIPDEAFEKLFAFFDAYTWHLDDRPLRNDNEINPDVLGYIFEKYVNQKQMGAYYTKEDITEYIAKNTIIPFLFDAAKKDCPIAFRPDSYVSKLLRENPDDYIYGPVQKGVDLDLPPNIAAGLADIAQRGDWNRPADSAFALPTETWREHIARRRRYEDVWLKLAGGDVAEVDDLITLNLNVRQFALDVITSAEGPELVRAFYKAISNITVLDPTCGSGAFLFAALNILEPLYDACLDRMEEFVAQLDQSSEPHSPKKFSDFRDILAERDKHPNTCYFILKAIILNNLYGVDIMAEAVEICKLRLFLTLVAQVETADQIEPLPDIDFNIRAGNTLVGYATLKEAMDAISRKLDFENTAKKVEDEAWEIDSRLRSFRGQQSKFGGVVTHADKEEVRHLVARLDATLNRYLAMEYGIDEHSFPRDYTQQFEAWRASHQPFHWFTEFYGIMNSGGFDVIIGNPPYIEYSRVRNTYRILNFKTETCGNLYAPCIERSYSLLRYAGRFGFIVQAPIVSTQRMDEVRNILSRQSDLLLYSTYDDRPSKLFVGMHHCRVAIVLSRKNTSSVNQRLGTTRYHKWYEEERSNLFPCVRYVLLPPENITDVIPKSGSDLEVGLYLRVLAEPVRLGALIQDSHFRIYYKITGVGHWFAFTTHPPRFWRDGIEGSSTRESSVGFPSKLIRDTAFCWLWSTCHYWLYQARTNCRDFNPSDLESVPMPAAAAFGLSEFDEKADRLMSCLDETSAVSSASYAVGGTVSQQKYRPRFAKPIIDEIDRVLARHYGFTDEELDFIINYDIKYRMGRDAEPGAEDE
ncbi:MAG TPA: DNA methyltransferase, partial [Thermomicrobiales bacterium]